MKRVRPAIPISVKLAVATRQFMQEWESEACLGATLSEAASDRAKDQLIAILCDLFGDGVKVHCDHDPALINRPYNPRIKNVAARYTPNANDPAHLIYRVVRDEGPATLEPGPLSHYVKTHVRGDGAQRSDTAERVHRRRVDKNLAAREAVRAGKPKKKRRAISRAEVARAGGKRINAWKAIAGELRKFQWPTSRKIQSRNDLRKKNR